MKQGTTLFLRIATFCVAIPVIILGIFGLYWLINNPTNPDYAHMLYPIVICMYLSIIPFFIALYQTFKLLEYIDKNKAFSELSVTALNNIEKCAITISVLYVLMIPFVYLLADKDDAPGLIIIGIVPIFASMVIAVFAAVLKRLLQEAIDIKSDNDLTI